MKPRKAANSRGAEARNGHQPTRRCVTTSHRGDGSIAACDLLIKQMQLTHERCERGSHACRYRLVVFGHDKSNQLAGVVEPLRCDDADLDQMPAKGVDQLRAPTKPASRAPCDA